jgi:anti-sigma factor RsiW
MDDILQNHLSAEDLQSFLEGELTDTKHSEAEQHLELCRYCSAELGAWQSLFTTLGGLEAKEPQEGFQERVMTGVHLPVPIPIAARIRSRVGGLISWIWDSHISNDRLQEHLAGSLSARQVARIYAHLRSCEACASQAKAWQSVFSRLDKLDRAELNEGFADRVMEGVRLSRRPTSGTSEQVKGWAAWWDAVFVPQISRAWGVISVAGVISALALGFIVYLIFSDPLLTPGTLATYSWWQMTDALAWAITRLISLVMESGSVREVYNFSRGVADIMSMRVALGALGLYSVGIVFALSVIYKQLILPRAASH